MVLNINYSHADLTSYYEGIYNHQGNNYHFTVFRITSVPFNSKNKEVIDFGIDIKDLNIKDLKEITKIKDEIILEFNKRFLL